MTSNSHQQHNDLAHAVDGEEKVRLGAYVVQKKARLSMSGVERLALAFSMSDAVRELSLCRLRAEHPDLTETDIRRLFIKSVYGVSV